MMLKLIISLAFLGSVSSDTLGSVYPSSLGSTVYPSSLGSTLRYRSPLVSGSSLGGLGYGQSTNDFQHGFQHGSGGLGYQSPYNSGGLYGQSTNNFQHGFQHGQQLGGYGYGMGGMGGYGYGMGGLGGLGGLSVLGGLGGLGGMGGIGSLLAGNTNPLIRNMLVRNLLENLMEKHLKEINAAKDVTAQTQILDTFASEVMHLGYQLRL